MSGTTPAVNPQAAPAVVMSHYTRPLPGTVHAPKWDNGENLKFFVDSIEYVMKKEGLTDVKEQFKIIAYYLSTRELLTLKQIENWNKDLPKWISALKETYGEGKTALQWNHTDLREAALPYVQTPVRTAPRWRRFKVEVLPIIKYLLGLQLLSDREAFSALHEIFSPASWDAVHQALRLDATIQARVKTGSGMNLPYSISEVVTHADAHFLDDELIDITSSNIVVASKSKSSPPVKQEEEEGSLANWKDTMVAAHRQLESQMKTFMQTQLASTSKMDEVLRAFSQNRISNDGGASRTRDGHTQPKMSTTYGNNSDSGCFFCSETGHIAAECPKQLDLIAKGIVRLNDRGRPVLASSGEPPKTTWPGRNTYERIMGRAGAQYQVAINSMFVPETREAYEAYIEEVDNPPTRATNSHTVPNDKLEDLFRMVNALQNNAHTRSNGSVPDFHEGPVIGKKAAAKAKASPEGRIAAKRPMGQRRGPPVYPDGSSSEDTDEENIVKPKNKELRFADPDPPARRLEPEPTPKPVEKTKAKAIIDPAAREQAEEDFVREYTRMKRMSKLDQLLTEHPEYAQGWNKFLDPELLATNTLWQKDLLAILKKGLVPVPVTQQNSVSVENSVARGSQPPLGNSVSTPIEPVPQVFEPEAPTVTVENGKRVVTDFIERQVQIMGHFKGVFRARSAESGALKLLRPDIEDGGRGDSLLDSGSMICSISFRECMKRAISYDPQFCIDMESANSSVERTLGLARNVKFNFGGMLFYLQLHVLKNPAYEILLGRPFEMISRANIQNERDGSAIITLTDESDRKISMPTLSRGDPKPIPGLSDLEKEEETRQQNSQASAFYLHSRK